MDLPERPAPENTLPAARFAAQLALKRGRTIEDQQHLLALHERAIRELRRDLMLSRWVGFPLCFIIGLLVAYLLAVGWSS